MSECAIPPIIEARDLATYFGRETRGLGRLFSNTAPLRAVDGVSLAVRQGEVVGLVGESGSGKTTLGRTLLGLETATNGAVLVDGRDIATLPRDDMRRLRSRIQMIPQDAAASLSPRMRVADLLLEVYSIAGTPRERQRTPEQLLAMVELGPEHAGKYPHELSGGQARRVGIARALAIKPAFIVADEPTAGLDVSAVAAVVNLLARLRRELGLSLLLITHDLEVVAYLSDTIAVLYLGRIVEVGPAEALVMTPRHPYTQRLLAAVGRPGEPRQLPAMRGDIPSPRHPPTGCRFHTRCPFAQAVCSIKDPQREVCGSEHDVACHFWREIAAGSAVPS